jgi:hypothetical protein
MDQTQVRLEQEVRRFGGDFAHVQDEHINSWRDEANGPAPWPLQLCTLSAVRPPEKSVATVRDESTAETASKPNVPIQAYSGNKSSLNAFSRLEVDKMTRGKSSGSVIEFFFMA